MRFYTTSTGEIITDEFCGGGGASTGMELATGTPVAVAVNHDPDAILMHRTNHPHTRHLQASVWDVDPKEECRGYPVGLSWFSPDCKHFSKAKGAALVDRKIRGLAWIVLRWAGRVRPLANNTLRRVIRELFEHGMEGNLYAMLLKVPDEFPVGEPDYDLLEPEDACKILAQWLGWKVYDAAGNEV